MQTGTAEPDSKHSHGTVQCRLKGSQHNAQSWSECSTLQSDTWWHKMQSEREKSQFSKLLWPSSTGNSWTYFQIHFSASFSSNVIVHGHCIMTWPLTINKTLNWLASLPIFTQNHPRQSSTGYCSFSSQLLLVLIILDTAALGIVPSPSSSYQYSSFYTEQDPSPPSSYQYSSFSAPRPQLLLVLLHVTVPC